MSNLDSKAKFFLRMRFITIAVLFFLAEILLRVDSSFFQDTFRQTDPYSTNIFTTVKNSTCHRQWLLETSLNQGDTRANSTFLFISRREIYNLHKSCKHEHHLWKFCVLDKSPFSLRWAFSSVITCENRYTLNKFQLIFDQNPPPRHAHNLIGDTQYVNVIHENINQLIFDQALSIGSKRNYTNNTEGFISIAILAITLSQHLNASIILPPTYKENDERNDQNRSWNHTLMVRMLSSATVHPRIFARTLTKLDRMAFIESNKYIRIDSVDFNFIYCDAPRRKSSNWWDLGIIFQAFHTKVWLLLLISLLIYSIILSQTCVYPSYIISAALALFTGLLGGNMMFGLQSLKYSVLFTLWSVTSMLLSNYYTGSMTSLLISPIGEDIMTAFAELDNHNYKLVFTDLLPTVFEIVNASAYGAATGVADKNSKNTSAIHQYNQTGEMEMIRKALVSNPKNHHLSLFDFLEKVAFGKKKSAFGPWPYCMAVYDRVTAYINARNSMSKPSERIPRHCHLGKYLVPSGGLFWGFFPPGNEIPALAFQKMIEAGIYGYWMEEFYGVGFASRVQERSRVKSPTSIVEDNDEHDAYSPMKLKEGHVFTIFLLWSFGIILSILVFIFEVPVANYFSVRSDDSEIMFYRGYIENMMW